MAHTAKLEVHQNQQEDVYQDRARVPEAYRGKIREGKICTVSVGGRSVLLEIRGIVSESDSIIRLDERTREELRVKEGSTYSFSFREVWWFGQFLWAWDAADSASRIAARRGLLGLALGLLGVALLLLAMFGGH